MGRRGQKKNDRGGKMQNLFFIFRSFLSIFCLRRASEKSWGEPIDVAVDFERCKKLRWKSDSSEIMFMMLSDQSRANVDAAFFSRAKIFSVMKCGGRTRRGRGERKVVCISREMPRRLKRDKEQGNYNDGENACCCCRCSQTNTLSDIHMHGHRKENISIYNQTSGNKT